MLCGSGRANRALDLRLTQARFAESKAFRRARLVSNQAVRGFAPDDDFAIVALGTALAKAHRFETFGSKY